MRRWVGIYIALNGSRIKVVARSLIKCTELNVNPPSRTKYFLRTFYFKKFLCGDLALKNEPCCNRRAITFNAVLASVLALPIPFLSNYHSDQNISILLFLFFCLLECKCTCSLLSLFG